MPTIALIGTLDSKGEEFALLKEQIHQRGHETLVIDVGVLEDPYFQPDITRHQVARAAGEDSALLKKGYDRGKAVAAMTRGVIATIQERIPRIAFRVWWEWVEAPERPLPRRP